MPVVTEFGPYRDDDGNEIVCPSSAVASKIKFTFKGSNNRVVLDASARIGWLVVDFDCDNGVLEIGSSYGVPPFSASVRIGQDASVIVGDNVSVTSQVAISSTEGTTVTIGDDVMFAAENQVRADDGHPIFDVRTGKRVNVSRSITIDNHVWLGRGAVVLGGSRIGSGSVIGYGSIVKGRVPNNVVAVGSPARVARRDIAWERPHLSLIRPFYKPDGSTVVKTDYWALTEREEHEVGAPSERLRHLVRRARRRLGHARARWTKRRS